MMLILRKMDFIADVMPSYEREYGKINVTQLGVLFSRHMTWNYERKLIDLAMFSMVM